MSSSPDSTSTTTPTFVPFSAGTVLTGQETKTPEGIHPIQLYSMGTPNGIKVTIALEEMGLKYDAFTVDLRLNIQFSDWFKSVNPNSKIPVLVDKEGTDGKEKKVFESGAILLYLAEKTGKFIPKDKRIETISWLFWQMSSVGPIFGQRVHFLKYAPTPVPYAIERFTKEAKRLLDVLEKQLATTGAYVVCDEYTIADMSIYPWIRGFQTFGVWKDMGEYPLIEKWQKVVEERPAVQRGLLVNTFKM